MKVAGKRKAQHDVMFSKTIMIIIVVLMIIGFLLLYSGLGKKFLEFGCEWGNSFLNHFEEMFGMKPSTIC